METIKFETPIDCIKSIRQLFGIGLRDAKKLYESYNTSTLRDEMAMAALPILPDEYRTAAPKEVAEVVYAVADAMLEARKISGGKV